MVSDGLAAIGTGLALRTSRIIFLAFGELQQLICAEVKTYSAPFCSIIHPVVH